ncbi:MAG: hypothetical protein EPN57_23890 [Paraburkholderia sp.]|nr:MAG: hypothetical protein EPN57_23890 [Paraburkholderia sp.]
MLSCAKGFDERQAVFGVCAGTGTGTGIRPRRSPVGTPADSKVIDSENAQWVGAAADGKHQWTHEGHPLYRFAGDKMAGEKNGEGFAGLWHVAKP